MKKFTKIVFCLGLIFGLMVGFTSCENIFDVPLQEEDEPKKPEELKAYYIAVQVHDAGEVSTRAAFDSDFSDGGSGSYLFNNGLAAERAICPIDGFENPENGPHFLLFFDNNGNLTGHTALTDWKESEKDITDDKQSDYFTAFAKLYIFIGGEEQTPIAFKDGKLLLVLNANENLCNKINAIINDTQSNSKSKYERIYGLTVSNPVPTSSGNIATVATLPETTDYLYLTHKGIRYFTMSSSMIIKNNSPGQSEVVPANLPDEEGITWYPSQVDAEKHPYSMYVERLQSKYTMLFKKRNRDGLFYFHTGAEKTEKDNFIGIGTREALVYTWTGTLTDSDFEPSEKYKTLKYVNEYTRSTSFSEPAQLDVKTATGWKVNIAGWNVNAIEKEEYLFKNLTTGKDYYNDWNPDSYNSFRNFWAEGKDYSYREYPDQYRKIDDDYNMQNIKSFDESKHKLNYFSYSQLRGRAPHQYSPEHTFDASIFDNPSKALTDKAHLRASSHLIICGQLLIEGIDGTDVYNSTKLNHNSHIIGNNTGTSYEETTDVKCKIFMDDYYWSEEAWREYVVEYLGYCMLSADNQNENKFGPNDGIFYLAPSREPNNKAVATYLDFESVAVNIKGGDGYVRVKPKKVKPESEERIKLYTYNADKKDSEGKEVPELEKYKEINSALLDELILDHPEYFGAHFYFGRMYYSVPVKHNTASPSFAQDSAPTNILTGDYGSVRNHWYYFKVNGIYSPGTSVADPAQKIIPNNEPEYETLSVSVGIFRWHDETTDVDISGQLGPRNN